MPTYAAPVKDTLEWRPRADVVNTMVTRIRRLKRTPLDPTGFLFRQPDGRPWSSSSMNSAWRRVLAKAGVRYRPAEQLRHTVASTLLSRGAPLLYVQAVGGWRSAGVLLKVYARWMDSEGSSSPASLSSRPQDAPDVQRREDHLPVRPIVAPGRFCGS